jgi:NifB/MoaA-like Fe-S oxidoreductase
LPTFSFGKNLDRNTSVSTYSGKFITGPEDVSKGWDAGVDWDLGNVIYSSDQTSIDSREKLMVELRNDLLSEATRIYYERRRLQIDLVFMPPVSEQEHLENLLRVDELTALLDGMTNGFFSKRLERIYEERPALNRLWAYLKKDNG